MVSSHYEADAIVKHDIYKTVFSRESSRPCVGSEASQWFRLSEPGERFSENMLHQVQRFSADPGIFSRPPLQVFQAITIDDTSAHTLSGMCALCVRRFLPVLLHHLLFYSSSIPFRFVFPAACYEYPQAKS